MGGTQMTWWAWGSPVTLAPLHSKFSLEGWGRSRFISSEVTIPGGKKANESTNIETWGPARNRTVILTRGMEHADCQVWIHTWLDLKQRLRAGEDLFLKGKKVLLGRKNPEMSSKYSQPKAWHHVVPWYHDRPNDQIPFVMPKAGRWFLQLQWELAMTWVQVQHFPFSFFLLLPSPTH